MADRGYVSPGYKITEAEEYVQATGSSGVRYGILGVTTKGPYGITEISSVRQLHNTFGSAYLGTVDGERVISQAIVVAERMLKYTNQILFTRMHLNQTEEDKFVRTSQDKLSFTIGNKDTTVVAVRAHSEDGVTVKVTVDRTDDSGNTVTETICEGVNSEELLKKALEYSGVFTGVKVPENYIASLVVEETPESESDGQSESEDTSSETEVSATLVPVDDVYITGFNTLNVEYKDELQEFENRDSVRVSVVAAPVGTVIELGKQTMEEKVLAYKTINDALRRIPNQRQDCTVLFDYPIDLAYQDAVNLFTDWYSIDEKELQVCYPGVKTTAPYTGDSVEASSSMIFLDRMAYTDSILYPWISPAGYGDRKGVIPDVISVNEQLTQDQRDKLYTLKVNSVVKFVGKGVVLFGNRTYKTGTPYDDISENEKINVVRLGNYIKNFIADVNLDTLFNPNDESTWMQWKMKIESKLEYVKQNRGVEKYKVIMDSTTVSEQDKIDGKAPGIVRVLPIGALEWIDIKYTLTNDGTQFEE